MNEQERELLNALLNNLVIASVGQKDKVLQKGEAHYPRST